MVSAEDMIVRHLNPELIASLGTMSDTRLAAKFKVSVGLVERARTKRGIAAHASNDPRTSDKEFMLLLGVMPDDELAYRYGCCISTVRKLRKDHSLPVKKCSAEVGAAWQAKHLAEVLPLLGTISDAALARRYGGFGSRYAQLRSKHGIAAFQPETCEPSAAQQGQCQVQEPAPSAEGKQSRFSKRKPTYTLPDEVMERLGKVNDRQLSLESGVPYEQIKHHRTWLQIPAYRKRTVIEMDLIDSLGKMKDQDVAAKFGRQHSWVRKERMKRGIPGFKFESIPGLIESLGTLHDFEVAQKYGVTSSWVKSYRTKRGIPVFNPEKARKSNEEQA